MSQLTKDIRKQRTMTVCGQHVLSGGGTWPGMMGTDDVNRPKKTAQDESNDEKRCLAGWFTSKVTPKGRSNFIKSKTILPSMKSDLTKL